MIFAKKKKILVWCDDPPEDRVISIVAGCLANHDRAHSLTEICSSSFLANTHLYVLSSALALSIHNKQLPSCLRDLAYLYLVFLTLVEELLFLTHLWSYFRNNLPDRHILYVHFESFIGLLYTES